MIPGSIEWSKKAWPGSVAQDHSRSHDGGVARHFELRNGWGTSYPETTGYIVPTLLAYADGRQDNQADEARCRARRMLDWLVSIQFREGGFQGGAIGASPVVPVTFNTGQILLGLAAGVRAFGDQYREPMRCAADWLVDSQAPEGCWRTNRSPFVGPARRCTRPTSPGVCSKRPGSKDRPGLGTPKPRWPMYIGAWLRGRERLVREMLRG